MYIYIYLRMYQLPCCGSNLHDTIQMYEALLNQKPVLFNVPRTCAGCSWDGHVLGPSSRRGHRRRQAVCPHRRLSHVTTPPQATRVLQLLGMRRGFRRQAGRERVGARGRLRRGVPPAAPEKRGPGRCPVRRRMLTVTTAHLKGFQTQELREMGRE